MLLALLATLCFAAHGQPPSPIGHWRVDHYELGSSTRHCYECPTVTFRADGTGKMHLPSGRLRSFAWQQKGTNLWVRAPQGTYLTLPNGAYQLAIFTDRQGERMLSLARGLEFKCVFTAE
jgi:hypothetical protein